MVTDDGVADRVVQSSVVGGEQVAFALTGGGQKRLTYSVEFAPHFDWHCGFRDNTRGASQRATLTGIDDRHPQIGSETAGAIQQIVAGKNRAASDAL